ncbi:TetR/AcrR family transcriptional regulator C-terminal domain-containing protein [Staphylococcus pseudintermedius]
MISYFYSSEHIGALKRWLENDYQIEIEEMVSSLIPRVIRME